MVGSSPAMMNIADVVLYAIALQGMRGAWRKQRLHSRPKFVGQSDAIIRHARCRARLGLLHAQEMGTASQMSTVPILSGYALTYSCILRFRCERCAAA